MAKAKKTAKKAAKTTGKKRGRPPGTGKKTSNASPAKARQQRMSQNEINKEDQALFLHHLPLIAAGKAKYEKANSDYRKLLKTAKSDGFIKEDFDTAFAMQKEGGEKTRRARISRDLTIAKYLGLELGDTLDLFLDQGVEEQSTEQRAYDAGKQDAMEGKTASPEGFDHAKYMEGFHAATEKRVKGGIKPTEPAQTPKTRKPADAATKSAADRAEERAQRAKAQTQEKSPEQERASQQRAEDAEAFDQPTSGVPMTRSQFNAAQQKPAEPEPAGNSGGGMFQRKEAAQGVH